MHKILNDQVEKVISFKTKNNRHTYVVEVFLKNHKTRPKDPEDEDEEGFWYDLVDEKTIQWTLKLVNAFRYKQRVELEINESTNEILDLKKVEE